MVAGKEVFLLEAGEGVDSLDCHVSMKTAYNFFECHSKKLYPNLKLILIIFVQNNVIIIFMCLNLINIQIMRCPRSSRVMSSTSVVITVLMVTG